MTALLTAEPAEVRQAPRALAGTAEEADALGRQLDRQRPPCWRSPSSRDYVGQLTRLARDLDAVGRSHAEAAEVLATYVRTLEEAQERARYAERLAAQGAERSAGWAAQRAVGPDPGGALSDAARRTLHEAEALERAAAQRAAARLRELAAAAPAQGWTSKVLRPLEDAAVTAVNGWRGAPDAAAALAGAAWSAGPWTDDEGEQREGRAALAEAARVWEGWLDAGRDAVNGRPGLALGALAGGRLPRIKNGGDGGFLDGVDEDLLTIKDVGDAWDQAHAAKALQDRIVSLRDVPLPGVEALLRGEVDLAHHEARKGHTILKHVGKRLEVLQARLDLETDGDPRAFRSTFPDLATAEDLVRRALLDNARSIRRLHLRPDKDTSAFTLHLNEPLGTVMRADGSVTEGRSVRVVLAKESGEIRVDTAYLLP